MLRFPSVQHEAKVKSLTETVKESEAKKLALQVQIDHLNEECAKLGAQGLIFNFQQSKLFELQNSFTQISDYYQCRNDVVLGAC